MAKRLSFVAGAAIGYVLGARAGRKRYEQISALAAKAMGTPQAQKAKGVARDQASHLADQAKDKAAGLAVDAKKSVVDKVHGTDLLSGSSDAATGEAGEQSIAP